MALGSWAACEPIRILGLRPDLVDLYFFAAQANPVDSGSLLAVYPINAPPRACVALSFSRDGVLWSRPINLHNSPSSFRTKDRSGAGDKFEFRSGDHPAAGIVHASNDPATLHLYIHHSVKGTSMDRTKKRMSQETMREVFIRKRAGSSMDGIPHVRLYRLQASELLNMTRAGLAELSEAAARGDHTLARDHPL